MSENLSRIRFFTLNYSHLQGLRALPVGILAVYVSVWARDNHGPGVNLTWPILVTIGAVLSYGLIDRYYHLIYGRVRQTPQRRAREFAAALVFAILALIAFWLDNSFALPFSAFGLVFAGALFLDFWMATGPVRDRAFSIYPENAIAAMVILIISLVPAIGLDWWNFFGLESQLLSVFLVIGISIILSGLWGHIRMLRSLPLMEVNNDDAI